MRISGGPSSRFTEAAARAMIGQQPEFNAREYDGGPITEDYGRCLIVGAGVIEDGRAMLITCESENNVPTLDPGIVRGFSIGTGTDGQP